jgi:radical SAM superfamily enzyme YgiQ (UPF0313 family)
MGPRDVSRAWHVALQPGATVLSPARDEVLSLDLEGRPRTYFVRGRTYKRSLASELFGRRTVAGVRRRWRVPDAEATGLFARAAEVVATASAEAGAVVPSARRPEFVARLERARSWTPDRLRAERERFLATYAPIAILPPDQYGAVVLQASFGCSWNRCTFCSFYQDRAFEVRSTADFAAHVSGVRGLLGRDAAARRGVFLADGNALVLANARLQPIFEAARAAFPGQPLAGFVDVFSGERKPASDWRELRELGLARVAIGVETGHDPLLAYLNKPGGADQAATFVAQLKAAGLAVQVILMAGVGGQRFAVGHLRDSARLLARLPLDARDVVYLSPFVVQPGSAYAARAEAEGLAPLSPTELTAQLADLRAAARASAPAARVALYPSDEFVY